LSHLRSNQNGEGQKSVSLQKRAEGKPSLIKLGAEVHEKSAVKLRDF